MSTDMSPERMLTGVGVLLVVMTIQHPDTAGYTCLASLGCFGAATVIWVKRRSSRSTPALSYPEHVGHSYPEHLGQLLMLTLGQFETAAGHLLTHSGYHAFIRVGGAGDLGVDLVGMTADGRRVAVQCKRYAPGRKIGTPAVQSFIGMMVTEYQASEGIFVTTSEFTAPAIQLAQKHGIMLIDGRGLTGLIQQCRDAHDSRRTKRS